MADEVKHGNCTDCIYCKVAEACSSGLYCEELHACLTERMVKIGCEKYFCIDI